MAVGRGRREWLGIEIALYGMWRFTGDVRFDAGVDMGRSCWQCRELGVGGIGNFTSICSN